MHKLQRFWDWVRSQHPSAQWNLRGGRWSSAEYCKNKKKKNPPKKYWIMIWQCADSSSKISWITLIELFNFDLFAFFYDFILSSNSLRSTEDGIWSLTKRWLKVAWHFEIILANLFLGHMRERQYSKRPMREKGSFYRIRR